MKNPCEFKRGDFVKDVYSGMILLIIESDKKGMAQPALCKI